MIDGALEKEIPGPFGTKLTLTISVPAVVGLLLAFMQWQRPAMGFLYGVVDLLIEQRWGAVFLGTTVVMAGFFLPRVLPQFKKGRLSLVPTAAILFGIVLVALAFLSEKMQSAPRWAGPSIGLVQVDDSYGIRAPLSQLVAQLTIRLNENVELAQVNARPDAIVSSLKQVRRFQHDIVVLDYDQPLQVPGTRFADLLNPRTLYVLTRPADPSEPLPPNVVSLSPPIVEEVYALVDLVATSRHPVRLLRTEEPRAQLASKLLRYALTSRSLAVEPEVVTQDPRDIDFIPDRITVWVSWRPATFRDEVVAYGPSVITTDRDGGIEILSITPLPYLPGETRAVAGTWRENQILALTAILEAHFVDVGRPLDTRISVDAAVERLATVHLATVSRGMRLVPRYPGLGGVR